MNKREFLKEELLKVLEPELKSYGFTINKKKSEFIKRGNDGWQKYQVIFLLRNEGWEINLGMLIRINVVEEIFHQTSGFEPKYQKDTPTIGVTVGNYLQDGESYKFDLFDEQHINGVAKHILLVFNNIAVPFFEK